jgi:hypothetical protein
MCRSGVAPCGFYHSKEDFNGNGPVLFLSEQHAKGKELRTVALASASAGEARFGGLLPHTAVTIEKRLRRLFKARSIKRRAFARA